MEEELQPLVALNVNELPRQINGLNGLNGLELGGDMIMHEDAPIYIAGIDPIGRTERVDANGHFVYENPIRARAVNQDQEQGAQVDDGIQQVINGNDTLRAFYDRDIIWGNAEAVELQPYRTRCERMIDIVEEMASVNKLSQRTKGELIEKIREIL